MLKNCFSIKKSENKGCKVTTLTFVRSISRFFVHVLVRIHLFVSKHSGNFCNDNWPSIFNQWKWINALLLVKSFDLIINIGYFCFICFLLRVKNIFLIKKSLIIQYLTHPYCLHCFSQIIFILKMFEGFIFLVRYLKKHTN